MPRLTDYERFLQACGKWKRKDSLLAIYFKDPQLSLPRYIEAAVCDINGDDYDPNPERRELPYRFYEEAIELVETQDDRLRSQLLANVRREERKKDTRQLELPFKSTASKPVSELQAEIYSYSKHPRRRR